MSDLNKLINNFINEALIYSNSIPIGNNKSANIANKKMIAIYKKIKLLNGLEKVKEYLNHDNDGVKLCVASILIKDFPDICINVLEEIFNKNNIYSLLASIGLDLYKKGKL